MYLQFAVLPVRIRVEGFLERVSLRVNVNRACAVRASFARVSLLRRRLNYKKLRIP